MQILKNKLLFSIIGHGQADHFVELARQCGAMGATVFPAKGTASSSILRMLGLGDISREVVMNILPEKIADELMEKAKNDSKIEGVSALISDSGEKTMSKSWKMITIIVNSGYADDIMETARKAGATGGTITHARGTAPEGEQERFMGITIVPEKEMIMILAESDKADDIVKAVNEMPCLQEPGIGIICTQDVKKFVNLGPAK